MKEYQSLVTLVNKLGASKGYEVHNSFMSAYYTKHSTALLQSKNNASWFNTREEVFERYVKLYYGELRNE